MSKSTWACPKCGSTVDLLTEKRPDGDTKCLKCGYRGPTANFWHEPPAPKLHTFGRALEALKEGKKVARKGWNGKGMYLWMKPAFVIKPEMCSDPMLKQAVIDNGGELLGLPSISMFTHDSTGRKAVLSGWSPSASDMLLEDWVILPE